ncbi:MAG: M48 family metalloprotease [Candidatus Aenigmarchaeota archaeon]
MGFRVLALFGFFTVIFTAIGILTGNMVWGFRGFVLLGFLFFLASIFINSVAYLYSHKIILGIYNAKPSGDKGLNEIVDRLVINAKIPKPKVYTIPVDVPNSFATGKGKETAVCVTEGLLSMNKGEIESVVAHEIWHIANNDILIQNVTAVVANILRSSIILIPLAIFLVKLSISEGREYRADYYSSRFSGKPKDTASALNKINEIARHNPMEGSPAFECLWIANPFKRGGFEGMFSTHPPTARRVKRIEDMEHEGIPEPSEATEVN